MDWVDINLSDIDAGSPITATLMAHLCQRDESALEHAFQVSFAEVLGTSVTYPTFSTALVTRRLAVPAGAKTLYIMLELRVSAGTGYVKGDLGGVVSDIQSTVSTTYVEKTLAWTDISSLRSTTATLTFMVSNSGSGNNTYIRSEDIIAARFRFD